MSDLFDSKLISHIRLEVFITYGYLENYFSSILSVMANELVRY